MKILSFWHAKPDSRFRRLGRDRQEIQNTPGEMEFVGKQNRIKINWKQNRNKAKQYEKRKNLFKQKGLFFFKQICNQKTNFSNFQQTTYWQVIVLQCVKYEQKLTEGSKMVLGISKAVQKCLSYINKLIFFISLVDPLVLPILRIWHWQYWTMYPHQRT